MSSRPRPRRACLTTLALLALVNGPTLAHDIWLHAERFRPERGDTLIVRQLVGAELETELSKEDGPLELPVLRDMTPAFFLATPTGTVDLLAELPDIRARPNVKPVLERAIDFDGPAVVAMEHAVLYTEHSNKEFLEYLEHESLDRERFEPLMEAGDVQTEGYQRSLKALVRAGSRSREGPERDLRKNPFGRALGQEIEIVPLDDPYELDPGAEFGVRVLLRGQPLAGQVVRGLTANGGAGQARTTDADGIARFELDRAGRWLVRLVHLARCSKDSAVDCSDTAWESYWSALSFELD